MPALVAERFSSSRLVVFSTGNVYPLVPPTSTGSVETDPPQPVGEYAQSCLGRERVVEFASHERGTRALLFRLNYAVDLRYGTLVDIARRVQNGEEVDLTVGWLNAIWQGDANSYAIRSLALCASPAAVAERHRARSASRFARSRRGSVASSARQCASAGPRGRSRCSATRHVA